MGNNTSTFTNLSSNVAAYAIKLVVGVAALPICIQAFGEEAYGLFLIGFGLSSSLTAFDLGASKSVFRFTVEYQADTDLHKYQSAINSSITLNGIAAVAVSTLLLLIGVYSASLFKLSDTTAILGLPVFILASVNTFFMTLQLITTQLLNAHQYFHLRNMWQYIPIAGNFGALMWVLAGNTDLIGYAVITTALTLISLLIDIWLIRKTAILKPVSLRFSLQKNFSTQYARTSFLHAALSFLSVQADRLIIGSLLNTQSVTIYTIITKPYFLLRGLVAAGYPAFQPVLSGAYLRGDIQTYRRYSRRIIRATFMLVFMICIFCTAFFYPILQAWMQTDIYHPYAIWGILSMVTLVITLLYTPHYRTLAHSDELRSLLRFSMFSVPLNLAISIILTHRIGFQGVILGTSAQILAEGIFIYYLASRLRMVVTPILTIYQIIYCAATIFCTYFVFTWMQTADLFYPITLVFVLIYLAVSGIAFLWILRTEKPFAGLSSTTSI